MYFNSLLNGSNIANSEKCLIQAADFFLASDKFFIIYKYSFRVNRCFFKNRVCIYKPRNKCVMTPAAIANALESRKGWLNAKLLISQTMAVIGMATNDRIINEMIGFMLNRLLTLIVLFIHTSNMEGMFHSIVKIIYCSSIFQQYTKKSCFPLTRKCKKTKTWDVYTSLCGNEMNIVNSPYNPSQKFDIIIGKAA